MENTYPEKFNSSNLSKNEKLILVDFFIRREIFDNYIKEKQVHLFTCPGCSYPTLPIRGSYEICLVCNWEDDDQDDATADEIWGGPNSDLSLTENRLQIGKRLSNIAEKVGGKIIHDANLVLYILHRHNPTILNLLDEVPQNMGIQHLSFSKYLETEEILLGQLISKS